MTRGKCIAIIVGMLLCWGCSTTKVTREGKTSQNKAIRQAIVYYIDGDYERAEEALTELARQLESDEELQTVYLYLGRSYRAQGKYDLAADAFSTGMMLGGDIRFEQLMVEAQRHTSGSARAIRTKHQITRAELAALIESLLPDGLAAVGDGTSPAVPADIATHWAKDYIAVVQAAGLMETLPDGKFHPEAVVTRPSFYFVTRRVADAIDADPGSVEGLFPGGLRAVIYTPPTDYSRQRPSHYVSGSEAAGILETLLEQAGS